MEIIQRIAPQFLITRYIYIYIRRREIYNECSIILQLGNPFPAHSDDSFWKHVWRRIYNAWIRSFGWPYCRSCSPTFQCNDLLWAICIRDRHEIMSTGRNRWSEAMPQETTGNPMWRLRKDLDWRRSLSSLLCVFEMVLFKMFIINCCFLSSLKWKNKFRASEKEELLAWG